MWGVRVPAQASTSRCQVHCQAKKGGFGMTGTLKNQGKKQSKRSRPNRTLEVFPHILPLLPMCVRTNICAP